VVPLPPCDSPLFGCLLAWTLVLAPCFFFSPFLGCSLLMKFGKVSSLQDCYDYGEKMHSFSEPWNIQIICMNYSLFFIG
jgi:hypothetical protein